MYRNLSRPPSLLLWRNGFGGSREGKRIQKVGESPATFRPIVRVGRCRRWITGFSTGQLVPVSGTASSNREGGGVEHPTGLNERLGIILPFRSRLSLIRLSYLVPSSRRTSDPSEPSSSSSSPPSDLYRDRFEWTLARKLTLLLSTISQSIIPFPIPRAQPRLPTPSIPFL